MTDTETPTLRADDYEKRFKRLKRQLLTAGAVVAVLVVLTVVFAGAWVIDQTNKTNRLVEESAQISQSNQASLKILRDATTPGTKLYEETQKRTNSVVGALIARMDALTLIIVNQNRSAVGLPPLVELPDP